MDYAELFAVKAGDKFVAVMKNSNSEYEYSIFSRDYKLIDGGVLSNDSTNVVDIAKDILEDLGENVGDIVDYNDLIEKTDEANAIKANA